MLVSVRVRNFSYNLLNCLFISEISYQEGSVYNSELNLTNPDAECQTDPLEEADYSHNEVEHNLCSEVTEELKVCDTNYKAQVEVKKFPHSLINFQTNFIISLPPKGSSRGNTPLKSSNGSIAI